jgi:formamidopyrimidine-DNA glycosylase
MPELPEVETVRRDLKVLVGKKIKQVEVRLKKFTTPAPKKFTKILSGSIVDKIDRRGKLLIFHLHNNLRLHIHLKMTGQLVLQHKKKLVFGGHPIVNVSELPNKYTHVIFNFADGDILYFNDLRQFGYAKLLSKKESEEIISLNYGVEPLDKEFTPSYFGSVLKRRSKTTIKAFLFDQKLIAGLGNIYVDESCFRAGVRPDRLVNTLTTNEIEKLYKSIKQVLALAVKHRGTTFNNYVSVDGRAGKFWKYCKVYGRAGEPCKKCGIIIRKIKVAQRGTSYCPKCQI